MRADLKVLRHSHQIGQRLGMHFVHYPPAMDFDRVFGYVQFGCNLFVKEPGNYVLHNFLFARSERVIQILQLMHLGMLLAVSQIAFYRLFNCPQQVMLIERLSEKLNRSRFHGLHRSWDIAMACKENNGDLHSDLGHALLQVEPA